jgi:hypothetical protein
MLEGLFISNIQKLLRVYPNFDSLRGLLVKSGSQIWLITPGKRVQISV